MRPVLRRAGQGPPVGPISHPQRRSRSRPRQGRRDGPSGWWPLGTLLRVTRYRVRRDVVAAGAAAGGDVAGEQCPRHAPGRAACRWRTRSGRSGPSRRGSSDPSPTPARSAGSSRAAGQDVQQPALRQPAGGSPPPARAHGRRSAPLRRRRTGRPSSKDRSVLCGNPASTTAAMSPSAAR